MKGSAAEGFSDARQALLEKLRRRQVPTLQREEGIPRRGPARSPELSLAQQRLWFVQHLAPEVPFYNVFRTCRLRGPLGLRTLRDSLEEIVRRHEVLRARVESRAGRPEVRVEEEGAVPFGVVDLRELPEASRSPRATALAEAVARRPLDPARGRLFEALVLRLGDAEWTLVLGLHHIVCDGWSLGILVSELGEIYSARAAGRAPKLAGLAVQYFDFALWQREHLTGERLTRPLGYWRERLGDLPPPTQLLGDRPRPATPTFRGALYTFEWPRELAGAVADRARDLRSTSFVLLLTAFKVLLRRFTGRRDLLVGSPVANRDRVEAEPLVGFFVNTLALRSNLAGNRPFSALVEEVHEGVVAAQAHGELPLEQLVEELGLERDPMGNPLFRVVFALEGLSVRPLMLEGLEAGPLATVDTGTTKFDLALLMAEWDGGLSGTVQYSTDLFDEATVRRLIECLRVLVTDALAHPERPALDLEILPGDERRCIEEWSHA